MNPGPVEEAGKLAGTFMDSLKQQPLSLALVVMNFALLGMLYWAGSITAKTREREITMLYEDQKEIRELLSKCVVPAKASPS